MMKILKTLLTLSCLLLISTKAYPLSCVTTLESDMQKDAVFVAVVQSSEEDNRANDSTERLSTAKMKVEVSKKGRFKKGDIITVVRNTYWWGKDYFKPGDAHLIFANEKDGVLRVDECSNSSVINNQPTFDRLKKLGIDFKQSE